MPRGDPSPKITITIDREVHEKIVAEAAREGVTVSAWMTNAARLALKRRDGLAAIAEWEKERGAFTQKELADAERAVQAELRMARKIRRPA